MSVYYFSVNYLGGTLSSKSRGRATAGGGPEGVRGRPTGGYGGNLSGGGTARLSVVLSKSRGGPS